MVVGEVQEVVDDLSGLQVEKDEVIRSQGTQDRTEQSALESFAVPALVEPVYCVFQCVGILLEL